MCCGLSGEIKMGLLILLSLFTSMLFLSGKSAPVPPPLPILPIPSARQLTRQATERAMFFHFGMNTFTDTEWGTGHTDPSLFNPQSLDSKQWVRVAKESGFSHLILTAKHHDGFCLWPSSYTNYSVKSSPWRNGTGDVVRELAKAAKEENMTLGLYLSPWDRHENVYGDTLKYNEFYLGQLRELLTMYGSISEVWLDGAKGEDSPDMVYLFQDWFNVIHQLQPQACIFSDAGPDVRWVGDEAGTAASTCWSMINRTQVAIGTTDVEYLNEGDANGSDWVPPECDVSIRAGWFWHENEAPKSVATLLDLYYKSVGRNCLLLLNVPPNRQGLVSEEDARTLKQFNDALRSIFSTNLAAVNMTRVTSDTTRGLSFAPANVLSEDVSTYWAPQEGALQGYLHINMERPVSFNVLRIREPVSMGQRIIRYRFDALMDGVWSNVCIGTTVGFNRLDKFVTVEAQVVRLVIEEARASPLIASLGLFLDTASEPHPNIHVENEATMLEGVVPILKKDLYVV